MSKITGTVSLDRQPIPKNNTSIPDLVKKIADSG